ncbi:MAG TPA: site-specific DNA-methyltransferase [Ignavibacteriales bacterium]|nr:site-specific DNA-methyltransferase [Ignavibacteriales bacterium]
MSTLYLGDCLNVLRENVPDESVDLIYIDPPFNSKRDYNIFFDDKEIQTQRIAFEDTWTLKSIQDSLMELHTLKTDNIYDLLITYQKVAPHAFPYLTMMSLRILELHRVLKPTGSFYLHCDPTMSHYLKNVCDVIFGSKYFLNEVVWKRALAKGDVRNKFGSNNDSILLYSKTDNYTFYNQYTGATEEYLSRFKLDDEDGKGPYRLAPLDSPNPRPNLYYEYKGYKPPKNGWRVNLKLMEQLDEEGRLYFPKSQEGRISKKHYLAEQKGIKIDSVWVDIAPLQFSEKERLGYPTQKPKALLERIIKASSNEGDTVLDAFCGCGTTVDAAESLHRNWIGIDISPIAISLIKRRLKDTYGESLNKFEIRGTPTDEQSAIELWKQNPNAFQDWWLTEFEVFSTTFGSKGADKGIDGIAQYLIDPNKNEIVRAAFQVKGGTNIESKDIDALRGAMEKQKCELGVFLTTKEPTKPMIETVAMSGFVKVPGFEFPRLQILTLKEFFYNKKLKLPSLNVTFKAAQLKGKSKQNQIKLEI